MVRSDAPRRHIYTKLLISPRLLNGHFWASANESAEMKGFRLYKVAGLPFVADRQ